MKGKVGNWRNTLWTTCTQMKNNDDDNGQCEGFQSETNKYKTQNRTIKTIQQQTKLPNDGPSIQNTFTLSHSFSLFISYIIFPFLCLDFLSLSFWIFEFVPETNRGKKSRHLFLCLRQCFRVLNDYQEERERRRKNLSIEKKS